MSRRGTLDSIQPGDFDNISGLDTTNFKLDTGEGFQIKNEGDASVNLEVIPFDSKTGNFVDTKFDTGWNVEIVKEIKAKPEASGYTLKWGV